MKKTNTWFEPYVLNPYNIEKVVDPTVPGVYILGQMGPDKKIKVEHIKSSNDVKTELKKYLGKFQVFMYKPFKNFLRQANAGQQTFALRSV